MPRKKKADTAPAPVTLTLEEQLEMELETAPVPEPGASVVDRLVGVGKLVASAQAAGIDVPLALLNRVPTQEEVIADYKRKAQLATAAKTEQEYLRDHLLGVVDASYAADPTGDYEKLEGEGFALVRVPGFHETLNRTKLVELGVDPDLLDRATVVTPYYYWAIKEPKAAKGSA